MPENKITDASRSTFINSANYEVTGPIVSLDVFSLGYGWTQSNRIVGLRKTQWGGTIFTGKSLNGNGINALIQINVKDPSSILSFERSQFTNKNLKNGKFRLYGKSQKDLQSTSASIETLALDVTINRGLIDIKFPTDPWGSRNSREINGYVTPNGVGFRIGDSININGESIGGSREDGIRLTVSEVGVNISTTLIYDDGKVGKVEIGEQVISRFGGTNYQVGEKILIPGSSAVIIRDPKSGEELKGVDGVDDIILIVTEIGKTEQVKIDNVELKYDRHDRVIYVPSTVALQETKETAENNIKANTVVYAAGSSGVVYEKGKIVTSRKSGLRRVEIQKNNKDIIIYFINKLNPALDDFQSKFLYTFFYFDGSEETKTDVEYTKTFIKGDESDSIKISFVDTLPYDTAITLDLEVLDIDEKWFRAGKPGDNEPIYVGYILDPANPGDNTFFQNSLVESSRLFDEGYNNLILTKDLIEGKLSVSVGEIITRIGIPLPILGNGYDITNTMINDSQFVITAVINNLDYEIQYEGGSSIITYDNFSPESLNNAMILDGTFNTTVLDSSTARSGVIEENPNGNSINTRYLFYTLTAPFTYNGNDILITYWIDTPIGTFNTIKLSESNNKEVINMSSANNYMGTDNTPGIALALSHRTSF
jgi:hypothetical protein